MPTQPPGPLAAAAAAQAPGSAFPAPPASPGAGVRIGAPAGAASAAKAVTALPFDAAKLKGGVPGATTPPIPVPPPEPKSKLGLYIGIAAAAALVAAGIAVVLEARMERAKAYDLQQQQELALRVQQAQMKAEELAREQKDAQDKKEMEAAVAEAKKEAEENTRREMLAEQEAARIAQLPGAILVSTTPAGASVSIDGAAPLKSPAKAEQIAPGSHHVTITLEGFDPVELTAEVKGSKTTNLGSVALQAIYGSLDLTSTPDSLEFALRPAADPAAKPARTGRTPASLAEVPHGDYLVTFTRPGCRDHVEKVTIVKGAKSTVDTKYLDGSLELTSDPSGASVNKDGEFLGTTPLTLHDLTPKTASFDLTLPGYDPTPISCEIPEGQTLKFSAKILRKDRVFNPGEVKTPPVPYDAPQPALSAAQRKLGADILISLVVTRDGLASNVEVVRATDDDVGRRCRSAVEKWKYRPATATDDRTVDARIEVPFKFPASP
jgi:TonB family protein